MNSINTNMNNKCMYCGSECKGKFCSVSCSNKYWNPLTKESRIKIVKKCDEIIQYEGVCKKCGKSFSVTRERKKLSGKNIPSYCSRECANSRNHSHETKTKIQNSLRAKYPENDYAKKKEIQKKTPIVDRYCLECGCLIKGRNAKKFCSLSCSVTNSQKKHEQSIIVDLISDRNIEFHSTRSLKSALIKIRSHQCSICKNTEWLGDPIPLVMDHIDGRANNNTLDNLRLVCGNCDMKLPTYKSKNKNSDRAHRRKNLED